MNILKTDYFLIACARRNRHTCYSGETTTFLVGTCTCLKERHDAWTTVVSTHFRLENSLQTNHFEHFIINKRIQNKLQRIRVHIKCQMVRDIPMPCLWMKIQCSLGVCVHLGACLHLAFHSHKIVLIPL